MRWNGLSSPYEHYQVDGRFDALALNAVGDVPGAEGISGTVQGDESGGSLQLDGRDITRVPSSKRDLAMVFQTYALYPHMTVRRNIAFPLKMAGESPETIDKKVRDQDS